VERFAVVRRGFDARTKGRVRRVYTVEIAFRSPAAERAACRRLPLARRHEPPPDPFPPRPVRRPDVRPVVVGAGPAGLFAALVLARGGAPPLLLERGRPVEERCEAVARFWKEGILDPENNVQFGEGGAGTFSDGKLTTRIGDPLVEHVLSLFAEFAGVPDLVREARPHVGTDRLRRFCRRMREELAALGVCLRFGCRVEDVDVAGGRVRAVRLAGGERVPCERLILAAGHSARDTFRMLHARGVPLSPKPFAVGLRVEHPQPLVDRIQYGRMAGRPELPPAEYRLAARAPGGRAVYSFCMCPGGEVVAASSEPEGLPVNGMSAAARDSGFASAGIVAAVTPAGFPEEGPLGGIALQERLERAAFARGGGGYALPAMNLAAFVFGKPRAVRPGRALAPRVAPADLRGILPAPVEEAVRFGLRRFGETMHGFLTEEATLYAVESRTSSPLRIDRQEGGSSVVEGLYPVGEGAGFAGGIVSSAVDGIRAALRLLEEYAG